MRSVSPLVVVAVRAAFNCWGEEEEELRRCCSSLCCCALLASFACSASNRRMLDEGAVLLDVDVVVVSGRTNRRFDSVSKEQTSGCSACDKVYS